MLFLSLQEFKDHLNRDDGDGSDDAELVSVLAAAESAVELYMGQAIAPRAVVEDHVVPRPTRRLALNVSPIVALTSVATLGSTATWDVALLTVDSAAGVVSSGFYGPLFCGPLRVTYTAGMVEVPPNVRLGTLIIAAHLWGTQQTPGMGSNVFGGGDVVGFPGAGYAIPNRAAELLGGRSVTIA